jgi:GTP cyclohydrolase II
MPSSNAVPLPRTPALLVQQAVRALRTGRSVTVRGAGGEVLFLAAESARDREEPWPEGSRLVLSGQRVASLGVPAEPESAWRIPLGPDTTGSAVAALVDATACSDPAIRALATRAERADELDLGAIELCKLAGLLPAAVGLRPSVHAPAGLVVLLGAIGSYRHLEALSLKPVGEARVPLVDAENVRIVAFRPADGGPEQLAIVVGEPELEDAPLCRLHSECFTGDLLGSLRCDCGDQLRGAIRRMAAEGSGVLLYLAQEGRGIGLTNKLRAYTLQDGGLDTVDANTHLGFEPDERHFWAAATMLEHLGITRVRLLTNNPAKLEQLAAFGIDVAGRVPHVFEPNPHNKAYLAAKALRSGHMMDLGEEEAPATAASAGTRGNGASLPHG